MSKIRVAYITAPVGRKPNSGPHVYYRNLITEVVKRHSDKLEVVLFRSEERDDQLDLGLEEHIVSKGMKSYLQIGSLIKDHKIDLIHVNVLPVENQFFYGYNCKKAITLHGDLAFTEPQLAGKRMLYRQGIGYRMSNFLNRWKHIDLFCAVSNSVITELRKHFNIDLDKVQITHNGIEKSIFNATEAEGDQEALSQYGLKSRSYILHINNYAMKKNALTLINSFVEYKKINKDAFLLIIGKRWGNETVDGILNSSGLEEGKDYRIIPGLPNYELGPYYRNAKVFLNPTVHETFGITNLEAIACGCPVITTNKYSMPEVIGDAGLLVDDAYDVQGFVKALDKLYSSDELHQDLVNKGIERSKQFGWDLTADRTAEAYLALFNK